MISKVLIGGCGVIAHAHAAAALRLPGPPRLAAADPSEDARRRFAEAFPAAELFGSVGEMLAPPPVGREVAVIATPPFLHAEHAIAALRSGRPALVEKPLAFRGEQARAIAAAARAAGLGFACCSSRFSARPVLQDVRRRLLAGDLGDGWRVRWLVRRAAGASGIDYQPQSRWFLDRSRAGGGVLFDWGPYDVAVWCALFDPLAVTIDGAWLGYPRRGAPVPPNVVFDVEHQVTAHLRLHRADGSIVPVLYERSSVSHGGEMEVCQVEGSRGALEWDWLDWQGPGRVRWHHERAPGEGVIDETVGPPDEGVGFHDRPLHAFAARLAGRPSPDVHGDQALFNFLILEAVYRAAREGRAVTVNR